MPERPVKVFFSYAREDSELREQLHRHLAVLRREGSIEAWYDGELLPGQPWRPEILAQLEESQVIVMLVSSDFLASDFCTSVEMERALERSRRREGIALPVIARACDWKHTALGELLALPADGLAVTLWSNRDEAWLDTVGGVRKVIEAMRKEKEEASQAWSGVARENSRTEEMRKRLDDKAQDILARESELLSRESRLKLEFDTIEEGRAALKAREEELAGRERTLASENERVERERAALGAVEQRLKALESELEEKRDALDEHASALEKRAAELREKEAKHNEALESLEKRAVEALVREKTLDEKARAMQAQEEKHRAEEERLTANDAVLTSTRHAIKEMERKLSRQGKELDEREAETKRRAAALDESEVTLAGQQAEVARREKSTAERESEAERREKETAKRSKGLDARSKLTPTAPFSKIIFGNAVPSGQRHRGSGTFTIDLDAAAQLSGHSEDRGTVVIVYSNVGPAHVEAHFNGVKDHQNPAQTGNAYYNFQQDVTGGGNMEIAWHNLSTNERIDIHSRWKADGAGRADVIVLQTPTEVRFSNCWSAAVGGFVTVYSPSSGSISLCAYADAAFGTHMNDAP